MDQPEAPLHNSPDAFDPWRHRFALLVVVSGGLLLAAGGLVTSTGSGLAVPDWPLSFGQLFPPMVGGVLFEHGHRMIATAVGALTLALMIWFRLRERRPAVRLLSYTVFGAVVVQGLLGGLTVLLRLPIAVSVMHACLAQIVFCLLVVLALVTSRRYLETRPGAGGEQDGLHVFTPAATATGLVFAQLVLGAVMRHSGAGLAIPDLPLAFGQLVPPTFTTGIAIHYAHRIGALLVAATVGWLAIRAVRHPRIDLAAPARLALVLVLAQILLGAASVLTRLAVVPTTSHLVVGALLMTTLLVLTLRSFPLPAGGSLQAEGRIPAGSDAALRGGA